MPWYADIDCKQFKVDGDETVYETLQIAEDIAEARAIQAAIANPDQKHDIEICGYLTEPTTDSEPHWYYITRVTAELKITYGEDDD